MNYCKEHGKLKVLGTKLCDKNGQTVRLKGVSSYWLKPFAHLLSKETLEWLQTDWKINCLRLPVSPFHYYLNKGIEENERILEETVETATKLGLYVIIDWHVLGEQDPMVTLELAKAFFEKYSYKYKDQDNIIYEICNEPNKTGTWDKIKEYAQNIIPVIRNNDPEVLIHVGTPTWSQDVDIAADEPLDFNNIMYSLHFYGSTHKQDLRNKVEYAASKQLPMFVNEFGLCEATGNGDILTDEADAWKTLLDKYELSYICWNLSTVNESSSILKSDCTKLSGWDQDDLNIEGRIVRGWIRG